MRAARQLVRRVGGVKLSYRATAKTSAGKTLTARSSSRVLPLTAAAIPSDGMFAFDSAKLNRYGKRFVRTLSGQVAGAKRMRCTGHTDSVGAATYNQRLGRARAKALCARLRSEGVKARRTVRSAGERHPRATNRTVRRPGAEPPHGPARPLPLITAAPASPGPHRSSGTTSESTGDPRARRVDAPEQA